MITIALETAVKDAVARQGWPVPDFSVVPTEDLTHGDFTTNIGFLLAKELKQKPVEVATTLMIALKANLPAKVAKIEAVGGFINFYLTPNYFASETGNILEQGENYGRGHWLDKQKIIIEYTDPNILKDFHLGHLMSNVIGESLSRLLAWGGAEVKRACYQSDVGMGIAKALWGKQQQPAAGWGQAYAHGATAYEENEEAKKQIVEINKQIYAGARGELLKLYQAGKAESLAEFEKMYAKLGTKFDFNFFESETGPVGKKLVEENIGKVFEESKGATVFPGEKVGLHTRVFLNSDGLPTYEAKELGLAKLKSDKWQYDTTLVVTGNEVNEYFKVVQAAIKLVLPNLAGEIKHLGHGMLRLTSGKMSSRTGNVIVANTLLEELEAKVATKMSGRDLADSEKEIIKQQVAVAAIKYAILKQAPGRDVIFDPEQALSLEGDSGPYLQYAYVRAKAVLGKSIQTPLATLGETALPLEKLLTRFPLVAERAGRESAPQYVTTYLTQLAGAFNHFYATEKIIGGDHEVRYLALTAATAHVLKNGLGILGIPVPERM
jgi:arginyl-tRNA synthetase